MEIGAFLARGVWTEEQIEVSWRPELRRLTTPEIEAHIEKEWKHLTSLPQEVFNGKLCRVTAYRASENGISITAAPTTYREYRGTHTIDIGDAYRANPLCVCAAVHTADDKLVLGHRSAACGESRGLWHVTGGHVESERHLEGDRIFPARAMRDEMEEELGIAADAIREMRCVGFSRPKDTLKPELLYYARVDLEFAALRPDHEHSELEPIAATRESCFAFLESRDMVLSGRACLEACAGLLP